jgi:hypothetical protein
MNPNHSERTKDERWEIRRLAKRVRGLYTAEQQALNFVAEAQTQSRGVCSQSIKRHAADYGYNDRHIQWGLHGRRRNGKWEYVGLISRGIVYVAGGYPKGGRAPGGAGLTPDYAINVEAMMKFIPEVDDETPKNPDPSETPEKGEPLDEPLGEPSEKKGEPLGDLMRTSCISFVFNPSSDGDFSDGSTARGTDDCGGSGSQAAGLRRSAPSEKSTEEERGNNFVVVGGAERPSLLPDGSGGECAPQAHPTSGRLAAPTSGVPLPDASPAAGLKPAQEEQVKGKTSRQEREDIDDRETFEMNRRRCDRRLTNKQVTDEFKIVFDRLCQQAEARANYSRSDRIKIDGKWTPNPAFDQTVLDAMPNGIDLEWKPPTAKQQQAAAEYFKAVGRQTALAGWEQFLLDGDHQVSQPLGFDETGKSLGYETVQQDWLLYIFVKEQTASTK